MIAGIVVAKHNSNRFPGKNFYNFNGKPLFWHNVKCLLNSEKVDDVYVSTDSETIRAYAEKHNVECINRNINISKDEQSIYQVLKYSYYSLPKEYEYIALIMANTIKHTSKNLDKAIDLIINNNLKEVRSYDREGVENGILILHRSILEELNSISIYVGAVVTDAKEVHYKKDLSNG